MLSFALAEVHEKDEEDEFRFEPFSRADARRGSWLFTMAARALELLLLLPFSFRLRPWPDVKRSEVKKKLFVQWYRSSRERQRRTPVADDPVGAALLLALILHKLP